MNEYTYLGTVEEIWAGSLLPWQDAEKMGRKPETWQDLQETENGAGAESCAGTEKGIGAADSAGTEKGIGAADSAGTENGAGAAEIALAFLEQRNKFAVGHTSSIDTHRYS